MELHNYQKEGIEFCLPRKHSLIADEMGLGKTAQAIGVINIITPMSVLIVCPASLKNNWQRELETWLMGFYAIGIANKTFPNDEIVIINYDILSKYKDVIYQKSWDFIIFDEAHYLKNREAKRTRIALKIPCKKRVFLTGTPVVNRPVELYPMLRSSFPELVGSYSAYIAAYCNARPWNGWDDRGASNIPLLKEKYLKNFMIRRLKSEVLSELPPKIRQVIELPKSGNIGKAEIEYLKNRYPGQNYEAVVKTLADCKDVLEMSKISKLRHQTALDKVTLMMQWIAGTLEEVDKLVVFAYHRDIIQAIYDNFPGAAMIHGGVPVNKRQAEVDRFQTNTDCRLFMGQIMAAGVGLTLTASSTVVFCELDWTPGNMQQAEDRCHRIGQKDIVNVYHLVLEGSLDAYMSRVLIKKQAVLDHILN